jgi:hypothetical protein
MAIGGPNPPTGASVDAVSRVDERAGCAACTVAGQVHRFRAGGPPDGGLLSVHAGFGHSRAARAGGVCLCGRVWRNERRVAGDAPLVHESCDGGNARHRRSSRMLHPRGSISRASRGHAGGDADRAEDLWRDGHSGWPVSPRALPLAEARSRYAAARRRAGVHERADPRREPGGGAARMYRAGEGPHGARRRLDRPEPSGAGRGAHEGRQSDQESRAGMDRDSRGPGARRADERANERRRKDTT